MVIDNETRRNIGKVHYQLAVLHGMGRFPDVVEVGPDESKADAPPHDVFSVLFHLAHASSLDCVAACLALGRLHAGLGTSVSPLLDTIVPIDFDAAKQLFRRAMESPFPPAAPKAAAGCLLYQIYLDELETGDYFEDEDDGFGDIRPVSDTTLIHVLEDIIKLVETSQREKEHAEVHKKGREKAGGQFSVGDKVEGNYCLEGNYYSGIVDSVSEDGTHVIVMYDDDGSTECLTLEHVRIITPPQASQTALGGPLSDEKAFGSENSDEKCLTDKFELKAELAEIKLKLGYKQAAAVLFEEASNEAMSANKMKKASEWSLKAAELME
jgi:elongation factor 2 kinase